MGVLSRRSHYGRPYTLWGALKKKKLMGYPFDCDIMGVPHDYDTMGDPHDYEIMGDP